MKGLGIFFDTGQDWRDMLKVFETSWEYHMDIPLQIIKMHPPQKTSRFYGLDTNTEKLKLWVDNFTEDTIFCDVDMMLRGSIIDGFKNVENIGYTIRTVPADRPFNAGVIYARYTDYTKRFLQAWVDANQLMFEDDKLRREYAKIVPGMNQPAMAYLFEQGWEADKVPEIYNMCDVKRWREARMIHVKSKIRKICLNTRYERRRSDSNNLRALFVKYLGRDRARRRSLVNVKKAYPRRTKRKR